MAYMGLPPGYAGWLTASEHFNTFVERGHVRGQTDGVIRYWVRKENEVVGRATLFSRPDEIETRRAGCALNLDYFVFPTHRGRGIAPQIISGLQGLAEDAGLSRLCAEVEWHNVPSSRSLLRSGFTQLKSGAPTTVDIRQGVDQCVMRFMWLGQQRKAFDADWPYCAPAGWLLPAPTV